MKQETKKWIRIIGYVVGIYVVLTIFGINSFDYNTVIRNMEQFCEEKGLTYDNRSIKNYCIAGFDRRTGMTYKYYLTFDEWENITIMPQENN